MKPGTLPSVLAVHSTSVPPIFINAEPSAWCENPVVMLTSRSTSNFRPDGRIITFPLKCLAYPRLLREVNRMGP